MEKPSNMSNITPREEIADVGPQKCQCSFGDSCAFKPEPSNRGTGKGRARSLSPPGTPHRNSKGDGKGGAVLTEVQPQAHKNLLVKIRQGKRTDHLTQISTEEVVKREIPVVLGIALNVQNSKLQPGGIETSVFTITQVNLMMRKISATFAIHSRSGE